MSAISSIREEIARYITPEEAIDHARVHGASNIADIEAENKVLFRVLDIIDEHEAKRECSLHETPDMCSTACDPPGESHPFGDPTNERPARDALLELNHVLPGGKTVDMPIVVAARALVESIDALTSQIARSSLNVPGGIANMAYLSESIDSLAAALKAQKHA